MTIDWKTLVAAVAAAAAGAIGWTFLPSGTPAVPAAYATQDDLTALREEVFELRAVVAGTGAGLQSLLDNAAGKDDVAVLQARLAKAEAALSTTVRRKK